MWAKSTGRTGSQDFNLEIEDGDSSSWSDLGCGKSTTLRMVAGLEESLKEL